MEERGVKEAEAEILTLLADTVGHFIKTSDYVQCL